MRNSKNQDKVPSTICMLSKYLHLVPKRSRFESQFQTLSSNPLFFFVRLGYSHLADGVRADIIIEFLLPTIDLMSLGLADRLIHFNHLSLFIASPPRALEFGRFKHKLWLFNLIILKQCFHLYLYLFVAFHVFWHSPTPFFSWSRVTGSVYYFFAHWLSHLFVFYLMVKLNNQPKRKERVHLANMTCLNWCLSVIVKFVHLIIYIFLKTTIISTMIVSIEW